MLLSRMDIKLGGAAATLSAWAARHAVWVVCVMIATAIAAGYYSVGTLRVDLHSSRIISPDAAFRQAEREAEKLFPTLQPGFFIVVEADDPAVARGTAERLSLALRDRPSLFADVFAPGLGPFYEQNQLLLLTMAETQAAAARLRRWMPLIEILNQQPALVGLATAIDQMGIAASMNIFPAEGAALLTELDRVTQSLIDGRPAVVDWQSILLGDLNRNRQRWTIAVQFTEDPQAMNAARALMSDPNITQSGAVRISLVRGQGSAPERTNTLDEWAVYSILAALALVGAIALLGLRSIRLFVAAMIAAACSLALIAGAASALIGTLTMPGFVLALVIIGLSIDGPLVAALRFREERLGGRDHVPALRNAARSYAAPLLLFALVMVVSFAAFWNSDMSGITALTGIVAAAMAIMLVVTVLGMPALLTLLPIMPRQPVKRRNAVLEAVSQALTSEPVRLVITLPVVIAAIVSLLLLPKVEFDRDVAPGGVPQAAAHVVVDGIDAVKTMTTGLEALGDVGRVTSVLSFIPSGQNGKLAILQGIQNGLSQSSWGNGLEEDESPIEANALEQLREAVRGIAVSEAPEDARSAAQTLENTLRHFSDDSDHGEVTVAALEGALVGSLRETTVRIQALADADRVSLETLDPDLKRRYASLEGKFLIEVAASGPLTDMDSLRSFATSVQGVAPNAFGSAIDAVETGRFLKSSVLIALATVAISIAFLLFLALPKAYDVLLVSVPIGLSGLILTGAAVVLDLRIVPIAILALPLLIGIGVGSGVKIIMRARERIRYRGTVKPSTPRSVLWSMLAIGGASAVLLEAPLPQLTIVGTFLLVGTLLLLICTFLVLPTLVQLTQPRRGS